MEQLHVTCSNDHLYHVYLKRFIIWGRRGEGDKNFIAYNNYFECEKTLKIDELTAGS